MYKTKLNFHDYSVTKPKHKDKMKFLLYYLSEYITGCFLKKKLKRISEYLWGGQKKNSDKGDLTSVSWENASRHVFLQSGTKAATGLRQLCSWPA